MLSVHKDVRPMLIPALALRVLPTPPGQTPKCKAFEDGGRTRTNFRNDILA